MSSSGEGLTGQSAGKGTPAGQARGVAKALLVATTALDEAAAAASASTSASASASASAHRPDEGLMGRCAMSCQVLSNLVMRVDFSRPEQYEIRTSIGEVVVHALVSAIPWTTLEAVEALTPLVAGHLHNKAATIKPLLGAVGRLVGLAEGANGGGNGNGGGGGGGGGGTASSLSSSARAAQVNAVVGLLNNCAALPAMVEGEPDGMRAGLATAVDAAWAVRLRRALEDNAMLPAMHEPLPSQSPSPSPSPSPPPSPAAAEGGDEGEDAGEEEEGEGGEAAEAAEAVLPGAGPNAKKGKKGKKGKKKGKGKGGGGGGGGSGGGGGGLGRQVVLGQINGSGTVDLLANLGLLLYTLRLVGSR